GAGGGTAPGRGRRSGRGRQAAWVGALAGEAAAWGWRQTSRRWRGVSAGAEIPRRTRSPRTSSTVSVMFPAGMTSFWPGLVDRTNMAHLPGLVDEHSFPGRHPSDPEIRDGQWKRPSAVSSAGHPAPAKKLWTMDERGERV